MKNSEDRNQVNLCTLLIAGLFLGLVLVVPACRSTSNVIEPGHISAEAFQLNVLDETFLDEGSSGEFKLSAIRDGDQIVLTIAVEQAVNLKALYCEIDYDPLLYKPQTVESTDSLDPLGGEVLALPELLQNVPGQVAYGQVLPWPGTRDGLDGAADLAVVRFASEPDDYSRATSATITNRLSQSELWWDPEQRKLSWFYYNSGDYNLSGTVGVDDLTVLGQNYKRTSGVEGPFPETANESVVDYDSNGEINVVEMLPLQRFYGATITRYRIYSSLDITDYPETPTGANGPGAVMIDTLSAWSTTEHEAVRMYYTYTIGGPTPGAYYWIRPTDGTNEGYVSTLAGGPD